jgi:hypothetical protein
MTYKVIYVLTENNKPIAGVIGRDKFMKMEELWSNYTSESIAQNIHSNQMLGIMREAIVKKNGNFIHYRLYEILSEKND